MWCARPRRRDACDARAGRAYIGGMRHLLLLASLAVALFVVPVAPAAADVPPPDSGTTPPPADDSDDCSTSHVGADVGGGSLALALAGAVLLGVAARRRR